MIRLEGVKFKYNDKIVLDNINLEIKAGEAVLLIGANGSGKSTLLKLINALIYPQNGSYFFEKEEITEKKMSKAKFSKKFHKRMGFVFQNSETQLFCSSVYEEIAFAPRQMGLSENELDLRVMDCLKLLNLEHLKDNIPYNLSGGEKKRLAIASILSMNPEIIVLDEAMNSLDPKGKKFLKELLIKLKNAGKTIISASHDFYYIDGIFDRAVVFSEEHKIVKDDLYKRVINNKNFLEEHNII